ncbi:MAG: hypothetical protein WC792_05100 [Candidatus Micrarchaeia archaeon]|jgi:hypothetical protein
MAPTAKKRVKACGTFSKAKNALETPDGAKHALLPGGISQREFKDGEKLEVVGFLDEESGAMLVETARGVPNMDLGLWEAAEKIRASVTRRLQ